MRRRLTAEFLGTFFLVFAGAGAAVVQELTGAVTHVGVALTFGLVVLALVYAFGDVSGAHLNPAVSAGFLLAGRMRPREVALYAAAQVAGALTAAAVLRGLFPDSIALGTTAPRGSVGQSFLLEVLLTLFLMLVILCVSTGAKEKGIVAGVAVGAVIGLEALFAGPISGASMNPARSLGPAVVIGRFDALWVYLAAPVLGALAAAMMFPLVRAEDEP